MKKGISIWSFREASFSDCFRLAKAAGYDGVEVDISEDGELTPLSTQADCMRIRESAQAAGIELYSVASGLYWQYSMTSNDEAIREKSIGIAKAQLQTAAWLGCDTVLIVPGAVGVDFIPNCEVIPYDIAFERALAAMRTLAPFAEQCGVNIGVENVWNKFLLSPLEMRDFIDAVGSKYVGAYFDVGNTLAWGYPEHWITILGNRIKKVHFKDYKRNVGTLDGFVDLLSGDVSYKNVMVALKEIDYDGWVTAEMLPPYQEYPRQIVWNTSAAMNQILGR